MGDGDAELDVERTTRSRQSRQEKPRILRPCVCGGGAGQQISRDVSPGR
jgi:hypothetical protein